MAGPVIGAILVFLWAFIFSVAQSATTVTGTANMPIDLTLGIGVGLLGGLGGAMIVWLLLYFVFGGRQASRGQFLLVVLAVAAVVGAVPASGFRVVGAGMAAEQDGMEAIRTRVDARRLAMTERVGAERDALVGPDFFGSRELAAPGGLARTRIKVRALRDMLVRAGAEDKQLQAQARAEIARLPVSGPRRAKMMQGFEIGVASETEQTKINVELSTMLFDEMDAQLDILERRRWVLEYSELAFTSRSDMDAYNVHARRIQEISAELDARQRAWQQRLNQGRRQR